MAVHRRRKRRVLREPSTYGNDRLGVFDGPLQRVLWRLCGWVGETEEPEKKILYIAGRRDGVRCRRGKIYIYRLPAREKKLYNAGRRGKGSWPARGKNIYIAGQMAAWPAREKNNKKKKKQEDGRTLVGIQNLKRTAWSMYSITCGWNSKFENMAGENV
jgi:hypothetical protein